MMDDELTVAQLVSKLPPEMADVIRLTFRIEMPDDWPFPWPPVFSTIGVYLGMKYRNGKALSDGSVRYIRNKALAMMKEWV